MTELELNQISKDIKGILNNIYKHDKLKIITSLCNDIEEKFNISIDDDTKEQYIKITIILAIVQIKMLYKLIMK